MKHKGAVRTIERPLRVLVVRLAGGYITDWLRCTMKTSIEKRADYGRDQGRQNQSRVLPERLLTSSIR